MLLKDWIKEMERIAPPELAMSFDNPGLLVSPESENIQKVLVALDCTSAVAEEAVAWGADLLFTHHPMFFHGVKHILKDDPETASVYRLLRGGVGLYAAHTNLDAAEGGVNDALMETLGVVAVEPLPEDNLGRIGKLPAPMSLRDFAALVSDKLKTRADVVGDPDAWIETVACVGGSGFEDYYAANQMGADVFLTGECKHHEALAAKEIGMPLVVAGHYETECVVLSKLITRLQQQTNDVQYKLALSDHGPFWR